MTLVNSHWLFFWLRHQRYVLPCGIVSARFPSGAAFVIQSLEEYPPSRDRRSERQVERRDILRSLRFFKFKADLGQNRSRLPTNNAKQFRTIALKKKKKKHKKCVNSSARFFFKSEAQSCNFCRNNHEKKPPVWRNPVRTDNTDITSSMHAFLYRFLSSLHYNTDGFGQGRRYAPFSRSRTHTLSVAPLFGKRPFVQRFTISVPFPQCESKNKPANSVTLCTSASR